MGIELSIRVTSPLAEEDRELLSGIAVMTLAIANHEMAKERFPETFAEEPEGQPQPCAWVDPQDSDRICIGEAGHRGRHRFRRIAASSGDGTVLPN